MAKKGPKTNKKQTHTVQPCNLKLELLVISKSNHVLDVLFQALTISQKHLDLHGSIVIGSF